MSSAEVWQPPPAVVALDENEVHVWRAVLDQPEVKVGRLFALLSADERERAARFHFERHRRRYTVGRGILRLLIGRYLNISPTSVQFTYSEYGKPALAAAMEGSHLQFNVSHSRALALFAFTWGREIGVDVEFARQLEDADEIASRFFSPRETETFRNLPPTQKQTAFFYCWTRKEAFIKAVGEGLSYPLDKFDVAFAPGAEAALLHVADDPRGASRWSLQALHPATQYPAALVVEGHGWHLSCWDWKARTLKSKA